MTAPNPSTCLFFTTTFLSLAACSSTLSLGGARDGTVPAAPAAGERDGGEPTAAPSAPTAAPSAAPASAPNRTNAPPAEEAIDERVFAGLTEKASQDAARLFKVELRGGRLADQLPKDELLTEVTALCGQKIWEQCLVAGHSRNELSWSQWTFKRKDDGRVYRYPDMFYGKAEGIWATKVPSYILTNGGKEGPTLVLMTEDKCGKPVDTRCQVRQRNGAGYVLTVEATGEIIDVMATLRVWQSDL